jgi:hypothetical protein
MKESLKSEEQNSHVAMSDRMAFAAMAHGGFTTGPREAWRSLVDARRSIRDRGAAAERGEAVGALDRDTKGWSTIRAILAEIQDNWGDPEWIDAGQREFEYDTEERRVWVRRIFRTAHGRYPEDPEPCLVCLRDDCCGGCI